MPTGSKLWRLKYRYEGKEKLLSLGPSPLVPLIEARAKRDEARKLLLDDIDPAAAKKEKSREEQLKAETTFMLVGREWHTLYKERWSAGHAATILHRMETDIFPDLGARPVGAIKSVKFSAFHKSKIFGTPQLGEKNKYDVKWEIYKIHISEILLKNKKNILEYIKEALKARGYFCMHDRTHSVSVQFGPNI